MAQKFLILRFSSIGDIILTTPVIRCLKQQVPDAEIHYATKKQYASLLAANPYIDKLHLLEEKKLPELVQSVANEKIDVIIDLHHNLRTFLIKSNLGLPHYTFNKINFKKWLLVKWNINRLPAEHIVDRYLAETTSFGVVNDGRGLDHFIPEQSEVSLSSLPELFRNGYYAFVIGAMHATKKLPVDKAIELCKRLNRPIVLIGGPDDAAAGELISAASPLIHNTCGKYDLQQSASLIRQSQKVYTHDTGMMHIAAALKKDVVSIWGNTIPEFGMYPYFGKNDLDRQRSENKIMEVPDLDCRPCSKIGFEACPKGHFRCMRDLRFDSVQ